jgi:hypothetical protein
MIEIVWGFTGALVMAIVLILWFLSTGMKQ